MADDYVYTDHFRQDIYELVPPDGRVIGSIGCGSAATEARLVAEGREVHGVDISPEAIDLARTRLTSARVMDVSDRQPFEQASLDGLILPDVLEHLPQAWSALESFAAMVRPGGWIAISVPNMRYIESLVTFVVKGDWPEDEQGIFDRTHIQVMTHKRLDRWCAQLGLVPELRRDVGDWRRFWRRTHKLVNLATFNRFRDLLTVEVQCRYRKPPSAAAAR